MDAEFEKAYEESLNEENATQEVITQEEEGTTEQITNTVVEEETQEENAEPTQTEPQKFNIDGLGEFTAEEIKEFRNGYMRQSDYTRKTQEIARQKQEIETLRTQVQNPAYAGSPIAQRTQPQSELEARLVQLEQSIADKELDTMIVELKNKYKDFDEVKVLNTAYEKGLTDLEFVYKSLREPTQVNEETLKEQLRQEILNEIQNNKGMTSTIIANGNAPVQNKQVNLSSQELAIATELGLTPDEYIQYK